MFPYMYYKELHGKLAVHGSRTARQNAAIITHRQVPV